MISEILTMLRTDGALVAATEGRIFDRPLKRLAPGISAEADAEATPEAFGGPPLHLLRPTVVVSPHAPRSDHGGEMPQGWAARYSITIAHYAPPGGEGTLRALAVMISRAIEHHRVPVPQGGTGRIRQTHLTIGPEAAPEFPNSGIMQIDTYYVSSLWRVPR